MTPANFVARDEPHRQPATGNHLIIAGSHALVAGPFLWLWGDLSSDRPRALHPPAPGRVLDLGDLPGRRPGGDHLSHRRGRAGIRVDVAFDAWILAAQAHSDAGVGCA